MAKKKKKNNIVAEIGLDGTVKKYKSGGSTSKKSDNIVAEIGLDGKVNKYGDYGNITKSSQSNKGGGDIAPVKSTAKKEEKKLELFQSGALDDDRHPAVNALIGLGATTADVGLNIVKGATRQVEGIVDLGLYGASGVSKLFGADKAADWLKRQAQYDSVDDATREADEFLDKYSVLGRTTDAATEGLGQAAGMILTGAAGKLAGLGKVGISALTTGTTFASSMGSGIGDAYDEGATDGEAITYGVAQGTVEAGTELLFGGLGKSVNALGISKGISSLDDIFAKKLSSKISNRYFKTLSEYGVKAGFEGVEEVLAGLGTAVSKKMTYMSEEELTQLVEDENLLEQFVVGAVTSGVAQSGILPSTKNGSLIESLETGKDFITGFTESEQKVVDKVYNDAVTEAEKNGEKLSSKEKNKMYEDIVERMDKGDIEIDTIEEVLGGETYKNYKEITEKEDARKKEVDALQKEYDELYQMRNGDKSDAQIDRQAELKKILENQQYSGYDVDGLKSQLSDEVYGIAKNSRLVESYNEKARKGQAFEADLTKYTGKQKEAVDRAIKSGVLNNTNKSHALVDTLSKIEAEKGIIFDYTDNAKLKESGFALEGKTINGFEKNGTVTLNVQSAKSWQSVVGHEISHVLEGTDAYSELQSALFKYAESKGELASRKAALTELYNGMDADIDKELTADLVGDYLFSDKDFIKGLTTNKTVFQKIYDEIKYLCKVATGKQLTEIEKVRKEFDNVWKEFSAEGVTEGTDGNINLSVSRIGDIEYVQTEKNTFTKEDGTLATEKEVFDSLVGKTIPLPDGDVKVVKSLPKKNMYKELYKRQPKYYQNVDDVKQLNSDVNYNMEELLNNSKMKKANDPDKDMRHAEQGIVAFDTRTVKFYDGNKAYTIEFSIGNLQNGEKVAYAKKYFGYDAELTKKIQATETRGLTNTPMNQQPVSEGIVTENGNDVKRNFSLSEDSNGNELSLAVQKRFANSKAVDENGNLKVLYHGTASGEFYTFDKSKGNVEGDFGSGFYFTDNDYDVENNYEDGGPDFENKVARRAEQIQAEEDIDYDDAEKQAREELYKGGFKHTVYLNIENPAIVGETNLFDYDSYAENYDREDYDSDDDYEGDIEQLISDDIDQIIWDIERNIDIYSTDGIADVLWNAVNEGGIDIEQLKANINNLYLEDNNGNFVGNEVTRQIIESLGYDGIIDNTVSTKFNMGLDEGTTHYIVFKPNQIKSIDNQNPTDDPDVRKSLSKRGEQPSPVGNYSTPLNETALAPTQEDISKMENTTVTEENTVTDNEAPMPTDADAPPEMDTEYYNTPDTTAIDDKTLNSIGKSLRETLRLTAEETKAIQEVVQEYSTTETPNKTELFEKIKEQFGEKIVKNKLDAVAAVKRFMRSEPLYISDDMKADITDWRSFRKGINGKIKLSKDGLSVDKYYDQLVEEFPDKFNYGIDPYYGDLSVPKNQIKKIGAVANESVYTEEIHQLDDDTIQKAVDIISDEVVNYKNTLNRTAAEDTASEALNSVAPPKAEQIATGTRGDALLNQSLDNFPIKTVEDRVAEKIRAVEGELADNKQLRRETEENYKKQISKLSEEYLGLKNPTSKKADNIIRRIARLNQLKASADADYAKRISDIESRLEKMKDPTYSRAMHKQAKMQEHAKWAEDTLGDTSTWKDKKLGLQYQTNTERRNLRDIVRDENGNQDIARADKIDDALNGRYNREEADKKRELSKTRGKYAELKITKAEDAYIQMLGELRHNPDTELTEKVVKEYYEKHKNKIDTEKVEKVIELARQDYDSLLQRVNDALREQGMKEIPYRKGYFPHFTEPKQNFIQKLLNWKVQDTEIPTSIAGLTEDFKPVKKYQSFDKTRYSDETDYSFMKGFDTYSEGALDWIYHIDTLQKRRAIENHIRYTHSKEGIQAEIKDVYADETLDAEGAQAKIEQILAKANNPLNNFVQDFMTHTNILAGKKNSLDRGVEQTFNRKVYSVMTNVQNRMSANMVLANVRSALTNFIPITQSWAQVSPLRSLQATKDTIANAIKDDGMIDKSTFLTNRLKNPDNLYKTNWDKIIDGAGIMFEIVDNISSQVIWRSKYNQNIAKGMSESAAIKNADQFAENVMAGRSKGNEPTLFNSKNPFTKAFTVFQLEVNNQYGYLFKDVPNDLKAETNHWKLNLAKGYTTAFIGAYAYNALFSALTGSDAALDPIGIIEDLLRDLGLFDDDEEKEPTEAFGNFRENILEELPFIGNITGGGRIPISSAIPYNDKGFQGGLEAFEEDAGKTIKTVYNGVVSGDWSEADWSGAKNIGKEFLNPLLNIGLPVGGGQIKKTVQGLSMFNTDEEHPIAGSYTDSGALRFPVDDTVGNRIQAGIFGQYASKNAREYFDGGYAPLKEKQIEEYVDVELPIADYWKYREGLKGLKKNAEKADYINSLDIEDWQKNLLMNNILDRKEDVDMSNYDDYKNFEEFDFAQKNPEKYEFFKANGISYEDYANADEDGKSAYTWAYNNPEKYTLSKAITNDVIKYKQYTGEMYDIKADKDSNGKSISGSRKEKVIDYINNLDADYETKIILFKTEYPSDDTYNQEIINYINNRDDLTYDERITIYNELGFTVKDGYVFWD